MWLEKYLLEEEKDNITEISNVQAEIIERREIIRRTINWEKINNPNPKKNDNSRNINMLTFQKFLKEEWFFIKEEWKIKKSVNKNEEKVLDSYEKKYFKDKLLEFFIYNKWVLLDLTWWLSNIDKIEKLIIKYQDFSKQLVKNDVEKVFSFRLKSINGNIISLIQILWESKWDIIDYYSNKAKIINLLKSINNWTKNFLNDMESKKI